MDADSPRQLRDPADQLLDLTRGDHHQVGELVDDDHDVGQRSRRFQRGLLVVGRDVAHAFTGKELVAAIHLGHGPAQRRGGLVRLDQDGQGQMRQPVVARELDPFGVDQEQTQMIGCHLEQQAGDEGVDANALALAGGAGDEEMRHPGQVGDDRLPRHVIAKAQREPVGAFAERRRLDDLANGHQARRLVGNLDADGGLARNRRLDAQRRGGEREREIVLERGDPLDLDTGAGLHLVLRHRGPRIHPDDLALHPERLQGRLEDLHVALDLIRHSLATRGHGVEQRDGRQLPLDLGQVVLGFGDDAHHRLGRSGRIVLDGHCRGGRAGRPFRRNVFGLVDLPQSTLIGGRRCRREARGRAGEQVGARGRRLLWLAFFLRRRCDEVAQPSAFGVRRPQSADRGDEERPRTEMDRHDEADHEPGDEQRPRADPGDEADESRVDGASSRSTGAGRQAEQSDQREDRDQARYEVDAARPGRLGPKQVRAERDRRHDRNKPRAAEAGDHAVADEAEDRAGVAEDGEHPQQRGQHQQDADDLTHLAGAQARASGALAPLGT